MPANLPPDYKRLEGEYRKATAVEDKLEYLKQMLALIPKHKGTDKMQAELKAKISKLKRMPKKKGGGASNTPEYFVERSGEGQVYLIGPPNAGKSALVSAVTRADPEVSDGYFATRKLIPGSLEYEDVGIQLVDTPSLFEGFTPKWVFQCIKLSDYVLLTFGLDDDGLLERFDYCVEKLRSFKIELVHPVEDDEDDDEERSIGIAYMPTTIILNKGDYDPDGELVELFREYTEDRLPVRVVSATQDPAGSALTLGELLFDHLELVRVYTKIPGKPPDLKRPFVLHRGDDVFRLAKEIHKDVLKKFKYARLYRDTHPPGIRVSGNFELRDKDIIEIHT